MKIAKIVVAILLSIFSTIVMSYIALAASIGPWIETTLVLCSMVLFQTMVKKLTTSDYVQSVSLTTAAGGIGGILATGLAFSLPTLYFLSPTLFQSWLQNPFFFVSVITAFCFCAGSFGLVLAGLCEHTLLVKQQMKFPIGELVYNAIAAPGQGYKALELAIGFCGTQLLLFAYKMQTFFGSSLTIINRVSWSIFTLPALVVPLDQLPMYLAVGFVTGHVIAIPLIVGFLAKVLCLDPLFYVYTHADMVVHKLFFSYFANVALTSTEFTLAFCSGMVLFGSIMGFYDLFKTFGKTIQRWLVLFKQSPYFGFLMEQNRNVFIMAIGMVVGLGYYRGESFVHMVYGIIAAVIGYVFSSYILYRLTAASTVSGYSSTVRAHSWKAMLFPLALKFASWYLRQDSTQQKIPWMQIIFVMVCNILFLSYFNFTLLQQLYLLVFSALCIYQMLIIAGRMGIIPLGRFATFVMVPGMFLFNFDFVQVTLVAAFVEIAGGVAGDVLFGRKLALLAQVEREHIVAYQWLGLLVSSLAIGGIFWLFISTMGLGPDCALPATKAASRALLIAFKSFDWYVLAMGFVFGYLIKFVKVNPALLLGGILMPPSISVMLIAGGLLTYLTRDKERYYPFLSGVSSGNSIWMLAETFLKVL